MNRIRRLLCFGCAVVLLPVLTGCRASGPGLSIRDGQGNVVITAQSRKELERDERRDYWQIVLAEAGSMLANAENCDPTQAEERLFSGGYQVDTAFSQTAFDAMKAAEKSWDGEADFGCALTDLDGSLLAVYSTSAEKNYAALPTAPYSSLKPLSVYMQAVERGIADWKTLYPDTPYKQLDDGNGGFQDWPANADGLYTGQGVNLYRAIQRSYNTVAVRCLADVGVTESITFLQEQFGMSLLQEQLTAQLYGEEEVIGTIALGYLREGVSPVNMAGYYQIFANGGSYRTPKAVQAIKDSEGQTLCTRQDTARQVIGPVTADIMNRLLQGVVAPGGTGADAACGNTEVAGKTGTGDDYSDNWFAGVSPAYSCAVWHGAEQDNRADELFAAVIGYMHEKNPQARSVFVTHGNLYQVIYCTESGKQATKACTSIEQGYFADKSALEPCDLHP